MKRMGGRLTNITALKHRITRWEHRIVQIKNQMMEAANSPGHVPYANFRRWLSQTREARRKIAYLKTELRKKMKQPVIVYYDPNRRDT